MTTNSDDVVRAEILLSRAAFEKTQEPKHPMLPSEFNSRLKDAEAAIVGLDTDAFDLRQRMEPLYNNSHLNPAQQERVMVMRAKLLKCLIEHGLLDGWGIAAARVDETLE